MAQAHLMRARCQRCAKRLWSEVAEGPPGDDEGPGGPHFFVDFPWGFDQEFDQGFGGNIMGCIWILNDICDPQWSHSGAEIDLFLRSLSPTRSAPHNQM